VGKMRSAYKILFGKTEEYLGRPKRELEDNIKIDFKEAECESVDWIHLAMDMRQPLMNMVMIP
jgi:hypothetical protein